SSYPLDFAKLEYRKLVFFVLGPDAHDISEVRRAELRLKRLPLPESSLIGVLGSAGLVLAFLRRRSNALTVFAAISAIGSSLLFYVVSRYRVTALFIWCLGAGALFALFWEARRRGKELAVGALVVALPATLALYSPFVSDVSRNRFRREAASRAYEELDGFRS